MSDFVSWSLSDQRQNANGETEGWCPLPHFRTEMGAARFSEPKGQRCKSD